jgi:predicted regulator of Ras-like GTPase activity (Roadblock/LC7/MglB family)
LDYSQDENILKRILDTIINSTAGIKHVILIDDTGLTIISQSKYSFAVDKDVSVEKIGAIGGAVFTAGEEQGQVLGYGDIKTQITEYDKGLIFSMKTGKGILCLATDLQVQIGFIRAVLQKWGAKIAEILERYLKSSEQEPLSAELKELFGPDHINLL